MCLAVPGRILSLSGEDPLTRIGRTDFGGVLKEINLAYVPEARVGDYVLVHVGFAITIIDEAEATRVFENLRLLELSDDGIRPDEQAAGSGTRT